MRALGIITAWAVSTGAAQACSPALHDVSDVPERGENCEILYRATQIDSVGLGQVQDLGGGVLAQAVFEGNGCYGETHLMVSDCTKGRAVVLGTYRWSLMEDAGDTSALERLMDEGSDIAGRTGARDILTSAEGAARRLGMTDTLALPTTGRLNVGGKVLGVFCGCRTFYPGAKPRT